MFPPLFFFFVFCFFSSFEPVVYFLYTWGSSPFFNASLLYLSKKKIKGEKWECLFVWMTRRFGLSQGVVYSWQFGAQWPYFVPKEHYLECVCHLRWLCSCWEVSLRKPLILDQVQRRQYSLVNRCFISLIKKNTSITSLSTV